MDGPIRAGEWDLADGARLRVEARDDGSFGYTVVREGRVEAGAMTLERWRELEPAPRHARPHASGGSG